MTFTTNVPQPTLGPTGLIIPDEASVLAGMVSDLQSAFGGTLNLNASVSSTLTTPQGQLATSLTAIIASKDSMMATFCAQVDPQYAQGRMQDALGYIYFLTRFPAASTLVSCVCNGASGTVIPSGALAQDTSGNIYYCVIGGIIGATGSTTLTFANTVTGPILCPQGTLNIVYVTIPGWDSITNPVAGTTGQNVESSIAFEARRANSVSINSIGTASSIRAATLASGNQLTPPNPPADVFVFENFTASPVVTGGITVQPSSVYIATYGGDSPSIAAAILSKKDVGCNYTGSAYFTASIPANSSTMTVSAVASGIIVQGQWIIQAGIPTPWIQSGPQLTGVAGGAGTYSLNAANGPGAFTNAAFESGQILQIPDTTYSYPQPVYPVVWTAAQPTPINVQVTLAAASNPPGDALAQLQGSSGLANTFSGADGGSPAGIGRTVYGSRFYQTINQLFHGVNIISVLVGTSTPNAAQQTININQYPTLGTITLVLA